MPTNLIEKFKKIIIGDNKSWVLFENGTCVVIMKPEDDIKKQAIALLLEQGPMQPGGPDGDFTVVALEGGEGFVVGGHHPDILTYISKEEAGENSTDVTVGMLGRSKRNSDIESLSVVHVEEKGSQNSEGFIAIAIIIGAVVLAAGAGYVVWNQQATPVIESTFAPLPTSANTTTPKNEPIVVSTGVPTTAPTVVPTPTAIPISSKGKRDGVSLGEEFTMQKGETVKLVDANVSLTLDDFMNSPCPSGAACIWAGLAVAYTLTADGKVYKSALGSTPRDVPYKVVIHDSDYKTYATFVITK